MKEEYEKTIEILTAENNQMKIDTTEQKKQIETLESINKDTKQKLDVKTKDYEKLLLELKRKEKYYEDKISNINSK